MITGFNTDIDFDGVTYHVQTEDKGLSTPMIMSLVYHRGTILASKRTPYEDLVAEGFDERVLKERLHKQHRLICAAVQAGRLDDLKKLSAKDDAAKPPIAASISHQPKAEVETAVAVVIPVSASHIEISQADIPSPLPDAIPKPFLDVLVEDDLAENDLFIEEVEVIDEALEDRSEMIVVPAEAIEVVSDLAGTERPAHNKLRLDVLGNTNFKAGEARKLTVMVVRGTDGKVIPEAQVMVKVIGSDFRPQLFHSSTDKNGLAMIDVQFPAFRTGRAACLIRAMSDGEEIEVRRAVTHV